MRVVMYVVRSCCMIVSCSMDFQFCLGFGCFSLLLLGGAAVAFLLLGGAALCVPHFLEC